jgi:hypothetical protein
MTGMRDDAGRRKRCEGRGILVQRCGEHRGPMGLQVRQTSREMGDRVHSLTLLRSGSLDVNR